MELDLTALKEILMGIVRKETELTHLDRDLLFQVERVNRRLDAIEKRLTALETPGVN